MKKVLTIASALALSTSFAFAQGLTDAYKYVNNGDVTGTARSMAMGGAFGALGGDISVMNHNPAGLAIYRSSEVVATIDVSNMASKSNWQGNNIEQKDTKFNFDNIAYVGYFPTGHDDGLVSWNVGFSYNRLKNFSRSFRMGMGGGMPSSLTDYIAARANVGGLTPDDLVAIKDNNGNYTYDPYNYVSDWLSVLGYEAGFIKHNGGAYESVLNSTGLNYNWDNTVLEMYESGAIDQYAIAFGTNISDFLMLGATLSITDLNYDLSSYYAEDYNSTSDFKSFTDIWNGLSTDGTGYGINVGVLVRPIDFLRIGVAYNSPTWYKMTDSYYARANSDIEGTPARIENITTPENAVTDYKYRTPDKWLFSAAAIIGQVGLISVDYEMTNYRRMKMYDRNGTENLSTNTAINQLLGISNTIRVGAEVKVTPQFAVRAGYTWTGSGLGDALKEGNTEVVTVGTIPHYTLDHGITNYTVGFGYRFTPQFYADVACVFKTMKEDVYAFSPIYSNEGDLLATPTSASLKTNTTRVALTLGYKF